MLAAITGATGLVGSNLALELLRQGHRVRCTRRASSRVDHLDGFPIEWVNADLRDKPSLTAAFSGADVVFHCAAEVSFKRRPTPAILAANVGGTAHVIDAVHQAAVPRLVHCSSVVARAISLDGQPVLEDQPWNFDDFGLDDSYSITKRDSEALVIEAARSRIDAVIVNPCYMLGPYDPKPSSGKLILNLMWRRVPGWTEGTNNFVDVRDVARGMILAWEKGRRGEVYILGGENMTYREGMARIAAVAGVKPPRFRVPKPLGMVGGWMGDLYQVVTGREAPLNTVTVRYSYCPAYLFSSEKARRELGYTTGRLEDAIRDAIAWFRSRGMV